MSFDGTRKTDEPNTPNGMTAIRLIVGYNNSGYPTAALCDSSWNADLNECEREHQYDDNDDDVEGPYESGKIPVSHVQRIMLFMPTQAPAAKVTKAMDISGLMTVSQPPVDIEAIAPDAEDPTKYKWE